jgi:hypothetical protein
MSTAIVMKNSEGKEAGLVYADRPTRITGNGYNVTLYAGWNWIIVSADNSSISSGAPDSDYKWGYYTSGTSSSGAQWAKTNRQDQTAQSFIPRRWTEPGMYTPRTIKPVRGPIPTEAG